MSNQATLRITREINGIQKNHDLSIAVICNENDLRDVKALIIGPADTPYEFGFFEFHVTFPKAYPDSPPSVIATTTNGGRCRFNPNIYAQGKVCLSILGTWRGERGEQWSSAQGLESILISIQSLMSSNPYENEPGFENANSAEDKKNQQAYIAKIRHETLKVSIINRLESYLGIYSDGTLADPPPFESDDPYDDLDAEPEEDSPMFEPFKDLCKRRFLWYYPSYLKTISEVESNHQPGERFYIMPFEAPGNQMSGTFDYPSLKSRLIFIRQVIDMETSRWAEEGIHLVKRESSLAASLARQRSLLVEAYKSRHNLTLDIDLEDPKNPFVWILTYYGRPMTQLDGGIFRIRMSISPRFPNEQPRVVFETKLFHHRIGANGVLCYFPQKADELGSHIDAIVEAIEEENPPYDPRTLVNLEASRLFWSSGEEGKKTYNRMLRRSVQASVEGE